MNKMKIVLLFAMRKEAKDLLERVKIVSKRKSGFADIYECVYEDVPFALVISGMGKAFAAASISMIHYEFGNPIILNFGVAGTLDDQKANIGDAVISSDFVQHDMDTSSVGDPLGFVSGIERIYFPASQEAMEIAKKGCFAAKIRFCEGRIASGDTFFKPDDPRKKEATRRYHPLCIDMESAAYGQIAFVYGLRFVSIRVISDAHHPETEYMENMAMCRLKIAEIACKVLLSTKDESTYN